MDLKQSEQAEGSGGKPGKSEEEGSVLTWGSEMESSVMRSHGERLSSQVSPEEAVTGLA